MLGNSTREFYFQGILYLSKSNLGSTIEKRSKCVVLLRLLFRNYNKRSKIGVPSSVAGGANRGCQKGAKSVRSVADGHPVGLVAGRRPFPNVSPLIRAPYSGTRINGSTFVQGLPHVIARLSGLQGAFRTRVSEKPWPFSYQSAKPYQV